MAEGGMTPDGSLVATLRNSVPRERAIPLLAAATLLTLGSAVAATAPGGGLPVVALPVSFWLMAVIAVVVEARPFTPTGRRAAVTLFPSVCLTFAILLGHGLGPAVAVQSVAVAMACYRLRHRLPHTAFTVGQYASALVAADLVLGLTGLRPYPIGGVLDAPGAGAVVLAGAAWLAVRYGTELFARRLRLRSGWRPVPRAALPWEAITYGALLLLSPVVLAAADASPVLVPMVMLPMFAVYRMARLDEDLAQRTRLDPLTGLGNRTALAEAATGEMVTHAALAARDDPESRFALLLLDLDHFKHVNDALGHEVGDRLLVEVGSRLRRVAGPGAVVSRLGGDEFAVLAPRVTGAADARSRAGEIAEALAEPVALDGLPLEVSGSIGVALYPDHGEEVATLLRRAEVAMYEAKEAAAPVAVYTPESDHHTPQRLVLLADLRTALTGPRGEGLVMHYQPQVAIGTGEVVGVEALLRWHHPTRGPVSPDEVIRVAEHTAVMRRLTLRIVDEVVEQVAKWSAAGVDLRASINVSIRDLHTGEVAERLATQMRRYGVPASQLQVEITESALMVDPRRVMATIAALDRLGLGISLDDFGTGYSSLQHVRKLPLAEVKVDRSYVQGMVADPDDAAVVGSVVELAGALGLRVVAEGVEDAATWHRLVTAGCPVAQGYYCGRAMPGDEILTWLARHRPLPASGRWRGAA